MHKFSPMLWLSAVALVASSLGCTMCSTDHMCDYAGVGGKWQRSNPACGRVGSILSDAGGYEVGSTTSSSPAYGDSWGLTVDNEGIESNIVDNGVFEDSEMVSEEISDGNEVFEEGPDSSSIMIGQ